MTGTFQTYEYINGQSIKSGDQSVYFAGGDFEFDVARLTDRTRSAKCFWTSSLRAEQNLIVDEWRLKSGSSIVRFF